MGPAEKERLVNHFRRDESSVIPAILSCVAGIFGLVMVAAGPWLLVTAPGASVASEQPAVQASASPAVEESRRVFEERRERLEAARQGGTQSAAVDAAARGAAN